LCRLTSTGYTGRCGSRMNVSTVTVLGWPYHLGGIFSEGDKRDSKRDTEGQLCARLCSEASISDSAEEDPEQSFACYGCSIVTQQALRKRSCCERAYFRIRKLSARGWDGHVFLEVVKYSRKPCHSIR